MHLFHKIIFVSALGTFLIFSGCQQQKEKDPQMDELQKDVKRLSAENQRLVEEIERMRQDMKQNVPQTQSQPKQNQREKMTVDRMKAEVGPLLKNVIEKIKQNSETAKHGNSYGMRVQYDEPHAFYGLIESESREVPYLAKVIVRYEKFLESDEVSRSYGKGSTTFMFAYHGDRWVLQSFQ
jgi:outer membrane murein-binding lipoprotein Lpp